MVNRTRVLGCLAGLALLTGCELGSSTIPLSEPQIVVHAVLNPSLSSQTILLEESRTGKSSPDLAFDPNNPIVTSRGIPISGAIVQLADTDGIVRTGTETRIANSATGIYVISGTVRPGMRYTLSVSAIGKTVTGSTTIPRASPPTAVPVVPFNRDSQSVSLPIRDVDLARAYWLRIEAPASPFSVFTTDREVAVSGDTRNLLTNDLLRVFFPGFQQIMTVAAADTNLYDYYRSANDPFSGTGLINHLQGGLGVFGSITILERRILDVTQNPTGDPIEGTYTLRGQGDAELPHTLRLYVESKASSDEARIASPASTCGAHRSRPSAARCWGCVPVTTWR
jgi:hypothetical protein